MFRSVTSALILQLLCILPSFHQVVITETRRVDTTWIVEGELTDRSVLSDELADFCAQYPIYHVQEAQETLEVTGIRTEGELIELTAFSLLNSNSCYTWQNAPRSKFKHVSIFLNVDSTVGKVFY